MKKLKTQYIILSLIAAYFLLNGFIPRPNEVLTAKVAYLMNEGYTEKAATKIAKVELRLLPVDEDYISLMED
jgi:hypothetical protein